MTKPLISFYTLSALLLKQGQINFDVFKGKKVLLVNTASDCGYTAQMSELQYLYIAYHQRLEIICFPSNDFGEQEKGNDTEIAEFCEVNFHISFPLALKSTVKKKAGQNKIYRWLTSKVENGWNDLPPQWNFAKYLINEDGTLTHYFGPAVSPISKQIKNAIES